MNSIYTLREIAEYLGGELQGDGDRVVSGVASLGSAGAQDLAFVENERYLREVAKIEAAGVIASADLALPPGISSVRVKQPLVAWSRAVELIRPYQRVFCGVSPQAFLGKGVDVADGVGIAPGVYVGDRVRIGRGTEVYPGTTIGADSVIGEDCRLYAGVHMYRGVRIGDRVTLHSGVVIGADGFGYAQEQRNDPREPIIHRKIPQVGSVVIEDDVEVGANTTIDRAALGATVIGRGTKIDNLVMVGHNCRTGIHCLLVAQVGLSGSNELGNYVTIAGQAGLAGHLKVGDRAIIGAKAGIMKNVEEGQVLLGSPALPAGLARRAYAQIENLPEFRRMIQDLNKRVEKLESLVEDERSEP